MHHVFKIQSNSDIELLKESGYNPADLRDFKYPLEIYSKIPSTNPKVNSIESIRFQNVTIRNKKNPKSFSVELGSLNYKPLSAILEKVILKKYVIVLGSTGEIKALNTYINVFQ